jgi:predicted double-glycine peptidase
MKLNLSKVLSAVFWMAVFLFFIFFLRFFPSIGLKISDNSKAINYLNISKDIYYGQTNNNCGPYSVMAVINILKGEVKDPEVLAKEMKWRTVTTLTFPHGIIDLLHKYDIKTEEYILKIYSDEKKVVWLKNQIDNGKPIILFVKLKYSQHYFTIVGYDENGFMIYDSSQERQDEKSKKTKVDRGEYTGNRYYTNNELMEIWNKGGYVLFFKNWAVVCS